MNTLYDCVNNRAFHNSIYINAQLYQTRLALWHEVESNAIQLTNFVFTLFFRIILVPKIVEMMLGLRDDISLISKVYYMRLI